VRYQRISLVGCGITRYHCNVFDSNDGQYRKAAEEAAMSYLGYVMDALLNDDLKAQNRRLSRRARRRRERSSGAPRAAARSRRSAGADLVRPTSAAKLGA
jgi:hypothetical protein